MIAAIIMMVIVAAIVGSITIITTRSSERSVDAARRVSNEATIQTAVTRVLYAYQNDLGSEQDYYRLDEDDLKQVTQVTGAQARVLKPADLPGLPRELQTVDQVWEHIGSGGSYRLQPVSQPLFNVIVEESIDIAPSVCTGAGLPASVCASGGVKAYWEMYRLIMPDVTGNEPPNVVVYLRSWLGSPVARAYSKASYARAELRPGRFADYQQISDGNVRLNSGASINGPVHSNGLGDASFSTVAQAPAGMGSRWIYGEPGVSCVGDASLSIAVGKIAVPGCRSVGATGQTISFLRAIDSIRSIRVAKSKGRPNVDVYASNVQPGPLSGPYDSAWGVVFSGRRMTVQYPGGGSRSVGLSRVNAFVFDRDVRVRGNVAADTRVTIAAERGGVDANGVQITTGGPGSATIFIDGNLTKGNDVTSSIGLIAQGDVVLWMYKDVNSGASVCNAYTVQAAMVAATGGLTIPSRYTTNELQTAAPRCPGKVTIDGSVAGHRPPLLVWKWPSGDKAGYTGTRDYRWDKELKRNPPPYFPLTGAWQPFQVRDANTDCLFDPARLSDPTCR